MRTGITGELTWWRRQMKRLLLIALWNICWWGRIEGSTYWMRWILTANCSNKPCCPCTNPHTSLKYNNQIVALSSASPTNQSSYFSHNSWVIWWQEMNVWYRSAGDDASSWTWWRSSTVRNRTLVAIIIALNLLKQSSWRWDIRSKIASLKKSRNSTKPIEYIICLILISINLTKAIIHYCSTGKLDNCFSTRFA